MTFKLEKSTTKFLVLLLLADLVFILLQIPYQMGMLTNPFFSIDIDLGYPEIYQYIKEYWIVLLLFFIAIKRSHVIYFAWLSLFIYLLIDDSLQIHETFGLFLVDYFGIQPAFGLRAQDFGELSVSIFFGTLLFLFIGVAYLLSDSKAKEISKHLFVLLVFLAFFGIIVDMLHVILSGENWEQGVWMWGVIEDGGEMLIMSIIVWYIFSIDFID
jgi:hypothetical protein